MLKLIMNRLSLVVLSISLLTVACTPKNEVTKLVVPLDIANAEDAKIYNFKEGIFEEIVGPVDSITLDIEKPTLLTLQFVNKTNSLVSTIYIEPGQEIRMDTLGVSLVVPEGVSPENDLLGKYAETRLDISKADLFQAKGNAYAALEKEKYQPLASLLEEGEKSGNVDVQLLSQLKIRLDADRAGTRLRYPRMYQYYNKEEAQLPEGFKDIAMNFNYSSPDAIMFMEGQNLAIARQSEGIDYANFESVAAYYDGLDKNGAELFGSSLAGSFVTVTNLINKINFGGGYDEVADEYAAFSEKETNPAFQQMIDGVVAPWKELVKGKDAPDFVGMGRDGKPVKVSELKGKKVYVDVWATWCGPCIAEIPALKKLEEDLHDEEVAFVSISIDQMKDKEKWEKFIVDRELGGLQLFAEDAWNSEVVTAYNIKGIPRFLMIDEVGKIISANAPRPSDPKVKEAFLN